MSTSNLNSKETAMNKQQIKGRWNQLKGEIRQKWGEMTDDDFLKTEGTCRNCPVGFSNGLVMIYRRSTNGCANTEIVNSLAADEPRMLEKNRDYAKSTALPLMLERESIRARPLTVALYALARAGE